MVYFTQNRLLCSATTPTLYSALGDIIIRRIKTMATKQEIIAKGFAPEIVEKTITLVNRNDYKRAQCPPILKVSKKAFGSGRRMPLVAKL